MLTEQYRIYQKTLLRFANKHRQRNLTRPCGIDFSSNDYLALSNSYRIKNAIRTAMDKGISVGAGSSRLLRGNHDVFAELEFAAAHFFESDKALYFINGYTANTAIFSTLPRLGDLIVYDECVHASMLDGIKASRAQRESVRHNDVNHVDKIISEWRKKGGKGRLWIAVESIYSMEGDYAPLSELCLLANHHDGFLVIDEAHATGVFGQNGRGLAAFLQNQENMIVLHTCGKALGVSGALVCTNKLFHEYLINRARVFIYSTAPSPLLVVAVGEALKILLEEPQHRSRLQALYTFANNQIVSVSTALRDGRFAASSRRTETIKASGSQILPIILRHNHLAMHIANRLQESGYDVRAIRPPSVPEGTARLRISITLHVSEDDISGLFSLLFNLLQEESP